MENPTRGLGLSIWGRQGGVVDATQHHAVGLARHRRRAVDRNWHGAG